MIYGILAKNENNYIGTLNNELPWNIPEDLDFFKKITDGNIVVMGRNTYDSIGKPLKNRHNIVISRQRDLVIDGVTVINSVEECIEHIKDKNTFIIGGAEIYKAFDYYIDKYYITEVEYDIHEGIRVELEGFIRITCGEWLTSKGGIRYRFCEYGRV